MFTFCEHIQQEMRDKYTFRVYIFNSTLAKAHLKLHKKTLKNKLASVNSTGRIFLG